MRARNFSTTTPSFITPQRVASHTMPLRRTSVSVFPCRSAVKMAIAFSSAERYSDTLNTSGACFPWREPPSFFIGLAIVCRQSAVSHVLYHKVCAHSKGILDWEKSLRDKAHDNRKCPKRLSTRKRNGKRENPPHPLKGERVRERSSSSPTPSRARAWTVYSTVHRQVHSLGL